MQSCRARPQEPYLREIYYVELAKRAYLVPVSLLKSSAFPTQLSVSTAIHFDSQIVQLVLLRCFQCYCTRCCVDIILMKWRSRLRWFRSTTPVYVELFQWLDALHKTRKNEPNRVKKAQNKINTQLKYSQTRRFISFFIVWYDLPFAVHTFSMKFSFRNQTIVFCDFLFFFCARSFFITPIAHARKYYRFNSLNFLWFVFCFKKREHKTWKKSKQNSPFRCCARGGVSKPGQHLINASELNWFLSMVKA